MWYRILCLVLLWPMAAVAQDRVLTLEQAIDRALREAPQVAASSARLESAQVVAPSAGRLPDPELATGVDNLPINTADRFSLSRDFMTMQKIGVMQEFPNRTKRRLQREMAERDVSVAQGELRKSRFETARATAEAWIRRAVAEQSLARLQSLKPDVDLQATAMRGALSSGRANAADALGALKLAAALDDRILSMQQEVEMQRAELTRWIGTDADLPLAGIPIERELDSPDALVGAIAGHAPLAPVVARVDAAKTEVELSRAARRPDWSAEISYAKRGPDFSDMVSLEFRVDLPLFPKNRQNPVIAGKLATLRAEEAELDSEVRMHTAEVCSAAAQWRLGRERLQHYSKDILPFAHDRVRAALAAYASGRGDLRGAVDSLSEEIDAQLDEAELRGSIARAWVFLHLLHDSGEPQ
jgi:outer membrane protein TolC